MTIRERNGRHRCTTDFDFKLALFRYGKRICNRIRSQVFENAKHLIVGLEVELTWLVAHPLWVANRCGCLDTQKNVVRAGICRTQVVRIICSDQRNVKRTSCANDFLIDFLLTLRPVALNL